LLNVKAKLNDPGYALVHQTDNQSVHRLENNAKHSGGGRRANTIGISGLAGERDPSAQAVGRLASGKASFGISESRDCEIRMGAQAVSRARGTLRPHELFVSPGGLRTSALKPL
jgi:hypothetical protein